ncbi:MAG: PVC-type heme-binding CxxCH protein, partial [Pirellulales bacterium]
MSRQWNSPLLLLPLLLLCAAIAQATANEPPPAPQPAVARLSGVDFVGGAQHHFGASMLGKNRVNYVYAQSTGEHATMTATFELDKLPAAPVVLHLTARDNDAQAACAVLIELNGQAVFRGRNTFANDAWRTIRFELPEEALKTGVNSLKIVNLSEHGPLGNPPWFMVAEALIAPTDYVEQKTHSVELIQAMPAPKRDIGAAKIDITPSDPVLLSGYAGRRHLPTDTVSMPLWARAIAIGSDIEGPALLLAVDNLGVSAPTIRAVAAEIEKQHNIPRGRITVHSTHTHSAPMLTGTLENLLQRPLTEREQASIDAYTQELIKKLVKVADEALQARRPLVLSQAHGAVDFAVNRRGAATLVDRALPILVASDQRGEPLVIVANYACHCVASGSGLDINGDWAGAANAALEREFPRATAIITVGCGGDQNPTATGSVQQAVEQGEQVAAEAARLMALPLAPIAGPLQVQYAEIELPLAELPDRAEWERRAAELGITGHHATKNLQRLDRGEALPTSVDYPIQTWVFGDDLAMVFLANEVVVDYALALKQTYDPTRLWVSGYTNDVCGYVPSERILKEGGYEGGGAMVWYDLPGPFAPGIEKRILDEVARQLPEQFTERVNPALTGGTRPLSPEQSIATMQTHDDLRVELVAAEPLVIDPVAIDFGHDGKLWVVEMRDYPEGLDGSYLAGGVVKFLVDTDNDGRYDKATTFLEDIPFPTGITVWRAGVLICAAPDVLYAEDTTGDGRANVVRKVLSGFHTQNYQARVNSISLGLDNWMHGAAGIFGGRVTTPNGKVVDAANRDFRFLPDDGEVQAVSGRTQQGRARDDWGNWFGCENGTLLFHYPTTEHYHPRNPHVAPPNAQVAIAKSSKLLPRGQLVTWALSGPAGAPTAVCGLGIYRDTTLGDEYAGNAFLCEPVNQLVHRLRLVPHGETFSGQRSDDEQDREFLASTDNWFRPVQARGGPDGALYIVDMYRYMIEHPRFLSAEDRAQLDVRAGDTRGRIYRVVPRDWQPPKMPRPAERKTSELPNLLNSSNGSLRDMIHLELLWRNEPTVAAPLKSLVREAEFPQSRLQALCLLEGLGVLDSETVAAGLNDPHPAVRRHAVRLSEPLLAERPVLGERLAELATDEDPQVRLQVAYSLGAWNDPRSGHALSRMLQAAAREPYTRSAVLSSLNATNVASVLANLLEQSIENDGLPAGVNEVLLLAVQLG